MTHLQTAQQYWKALLTPSDTAIDATCGNGNDALFLCTLLQKGTVIGLDIQPEALEKTATLLGSHPISLHLLCHSQIDTLKLSQPPQLIVYNLGYLPRGNKNLTTMTKTTLMSIEKSLKLVAPQGAISITCYPGHPEGAEEEIKLLEFVSSLPSHEWTVCFHRWINRPKAPSLLWIQKK